jgi:uncharacterized protein YjbJ (UPF0337 family)
MSWVGQSKWRDRKSRVYPYVAPFVWGIGHQEKIMSINKDQIKGRVTEAKGKIKEVAGKLVGNQKLEAKGKIEKTVGKVQAGYGDIKKDVKGAM